MQGDSARQSLQQPPTPGGVTIVVEGLNPARCPLHEDQLPDRLGDFGNKLNRAGPVANHGDRLVAEVVIVVPAGAVPLRAGKGFGSWELVAAAAANRVPSIRGEARTFDRERPSRYRRRSFSPATILPPHRTPRIQPTFSIGCANRSGNDQRNA